MEWLHQALVSPELRVVAIPSALVLGAVAAVAGSCCSPVVLGVVAGYSGSAESGSRRTNILRALFFLAGTVAALALLGAMVGFVSQAVGVRFAHYGRILAGLVTILFGLAATDLLPFHITKVGIANRPAPAGLLGAAAFGLAAGAASAACMTCCSPLLMVPLGVAALRGQTLLGAGILAAFALGYGLTLVALAIGLQTGLGRVKRTSHRTMSIVNTATGILLLATGFYLLATA